MKNRKDFITFLSLLERHCDDEDYIQARIKKIFESAKRELAFGGRR